MTHFGADEKILLGSHRGRRGSTRTKGQVLLLIYPEWRGYEFFLVRDQIVVVDPRTGEIVDVIPA